MMIETLAILALLAFVALLIAVVCI